MALLELILPRLYDKTKANLCFYLRFYLCFHDKTEANLRFYVRFYDKTEANLRFLPSVFLPLFLEVILEAVEAVTVKNECGTVPKTELLYSLAAFFDTLIDYTIPNI